MLENLKSYFGGMKSKDLWGTQLLIAAVVCFAFWWSGGDPEKTKALLDAAFGALSLIAGLAGATIGGRSLIDMAVIKAGNGNGKTPPAVPAASAPAPAPAQPANS